MTFVKKLLSVTMAIILVVSLAAVGVSAAGTASGDEYMTITVSTNKDSYLPGDTVTVTVSLKNNYNCTALRFPVMYDSSVYELATPYRLTWYNQCKDNGTGGVNADNDGSFVPDAYNADEWGCLLFQWTANVSAGEVGKINNEAGQTCLSFDLIVKEDALAGKAGTIFVPEEYTGFYYQAIQDTTDALTFYYLSADTLTRTFVPANPLVTGDPIELVKVNGSTTVIDETNKYVYALKSPINSVIEFDNFLDVKGTNVSLQYVPTTYGYGTGAKVRIMLGDNIVSEYQVVIFGDVNGDSFVDSFDLLDVLEVVNFVKTYEGITLFAGDVYTAQAGATSGDGVVDSMDLLKLLDVANFIKTINQVHPYQ